MFENKKYNKNPTLEPKKQFINNDINIEEYNLTALSTIIAVSIIFLLSLKIIVMTGI